MSYGRDARGERTVSRGGGGLATALRGLVEQHDVTWIANAMTEEDRAVARELAERMGGELRLEPAVDRTAFVLELPRVSTGNPPPLRGNRHEDRVG